MSAKSAVVLDANGDPLQTGDTVISGKRFDAGHVHWGVIVSLDPEAMRIDVWHRVGCCEAGRITEGCESKFWLRVIKRPTAWQRILKDEVLEKRGKTNRSRSS